jgi:hypothetical protein
MLKTVRSSGAPILLVALCLLVSLVDPAAGAWAFDIVEALEAVSESHVPSGSFPLTLRPLWPPAPVSSASLRSPRAAPYGLVVRATGRRVGHFALDDPPTAEDH